MKQLIPFMFLMIACSSELLAQTDTTTLTTDSAASQNIEEIFNNPEVAPEFPGGIDSLKSFVQKNLKWPKDQEDRVGRVYVQFIVEKDGSISGIQVLKGINEDYDAEAKRVISIMPKWEPGKRRDIPIRMRMAFPITFDRTQDL